MNKINDAEVVIECRTNYPFSGTLSYTVTSEAAFDFFVRIPAWAMTNNTSTYQVRRARRQRVTPNSDGLQQFKIEKGRTSIEVDLSMSIVAEPHNGSVAMYYGPLLYALDIDYANATYHTPLD